MLTWLLDPISYEFMRNAIVVGSLVGILCPIVGTYLIVQRMSMMGDVIAHAILPGLAIANFLKIDLLIGAFCSGIFSTAVIHWIRNQSRVKVDAAMALTFASFFALGITLLTLFQSRLDLEKLLFGDILSVTRLDIDRTVIVTLVILSLVKYFYQPLLFFSFDRVGAEAMGLPIQRLNFGLMAAITLTVIIGMKTVGVILVISLLIGPAITAYLWVKELHWMMVLGSILGALSSLGGLYLSYYWDLPSGPAIALVIVSLFAITLLFNPTQGILTQHPIKD